MKCPADDDFRTETPFLLHKEDVQSVLQSMEGYLGSPLPKKSNINFHKLMFESLADQKYDIALYAYFKIAEVCCQKS